MTRNAMLFIDEVGKEYPTGCGAGISGPDVSKVKYEEVTGSKNEHVCVYKIQMMVVIQVTFSYG